MKLDEKWQQLVAESHAARKVLDEALAPVLEKLIAIGAGRSRENSPKEDARLQAASEVLDEIHVRMKEFIAENTGRR
jgi:hypothetical protein